MAAESSGPVKHLRLMEKLQRDIEHVAGLLNQLDVEGADRASIMQEVSDLLRTIRTMQGQIQDPASWQAIHTHANALDAAYKLHARATRDTRSGMNCPV